MDEPVLEQTRTLYASARCQLVVERWGSVDGSIERPVVHHPGAVAMIVRPTPDSLLLVRQYRYPIRRWTLEIPAGTRDPGEDPAATAARELEEETGLVASRFEERLRLIPAVGISDEELIIYEAFDCRPGRAAPDAGELITAECVALDRLPALRREGLICDAKTLLALALIGCGEAVTAC